MSDQSTSSHRGIILLSCAALALVVLSGLCLIAFSWHAVNHQEAVRETVVVRRMMTNMLARVEGETASSASWDELYRRTQTGIDQDWVDRNVAGLYRVSFGHDFTLIFDDQAQLRFASHEGVTSDPRRDQALARVLAPLVQRVQIEEMRRRRGLDPPGPAPLGNVANRSTVVEAGGVSAFAGVCTIAPSDGNARGARPAYVLVSGKQVDGRFLKQLEDDAAITGAKAITRAADGLGVVPYPGAVGGVTWAVAKPGVAVVKQASGYILLVAALLALTLLALALRVRQLILRIQADDAALKATMDHLVEARDLARSASVAKSQFIANISHEIRTPLNGVLGMAQALERDPLNPTQRERVNTILRSGAALLSVLNDVLDISKVEAGKLEIAEAPFDLQDLIASVCASYHDTALSKGVDLTSRTPQALHGAWLGDPARIRQILLNLVSNAVKFTEAGQVTVEAAASPGGLEVVVRDQGAGIPAAKLPFLFQKFSQVDGSATRRFGGAGLGLAISRELALLMGGDIEVESREGEGSAFHLILPLTRPVQPEGAVPAPMAAETAPSHADRPLRVLAAEDNPTNQLVLKTLLEPLDIDLVLVGNGAEAVEAARLGGFDLILMDVQMPVMDGLDATRAVRRVERELGRAPTPILALTANAMRHQVETYMEIGMNGVVAKPVQAESLWAAIAAAVNAPAAELPETLATTS